MSTLLTKVYTNRYLNSYAKASWMRVKSVEQVAPSPTLGWSLERADTIQAASCMPPLFRVPDMGGNGVKTESKSSSTVFF